MGVHGLQCSNRRHRKRIQINQRIVAKHKKKIDKMTKKILRTLKTKEGERIAKNKAAQQEK